MSKIQKQDYYFGAALSVLLTRNKDSRPSLIEHRGDSRRYEIATSSSDDFSLYMKYSGSPSVKGDERTWRFSLSDSDKDRIDKCIKKGFKTLIILICGGECDKEGMLKDGEIVVLTEKEYKMKVEQKTGITVKLKGERPKVYEIKDRGDEPLKVLRNRFDKKLTEIKDSI